MTNELESDIEYFKACIKLMPKGKSIADYMIDIGICERAIQALEKQMPKKPIYNNKYPYGNRDSCPRCNEIINYRIDNHCHRCGQKIDWSDEE